MIALAPRAQAQGNWGLSSTYKGNDRELGARSDSRVASVHTGFHAATPGCSLSQ